MLNFQVDLTNCDREPIHIPGKIQSHGFIIVIDQENIIRFCSDNIGFFIPKAGTGLLGRSVEYIEQFVETGLQGNALIQLLQLGRLSGYEQINPLLVSIMGEKYNLIISRSAEFEILEIEPVAAVAVQDVNKMIGKSVSQMLADKSLQNLLNNTAIQVKQIIHFDRVMIYRFAQDGHGEVVAEAKNDDLEDWLHLHYPASDIPRQARELYKLNLTRLIADVHAVPAGISTEAAQTQPLDLTWTQLRAVSPIHIQYLKNMGVASSFSISLIYKNELWGLVACHNYTPKFIDFKSRESAKLIGQILSSALEFRQDEENQLIHDRFKDNLEQIVKNLRSNENIFEALAKGGLNILNLTHASGAALIYEKKIYRVGITPDEDALKQLVEWAARQIHEPAYMSTNLSSVYPAAYPYRKQAAGVLMLELTRELNEYIFWFKPERLETIKWAGNPEKPVEFDEHGLLQISPRHSFQVWSQEVKGNSEAWHQDELLSAIRLKGEINHAINLKAGALRLLNEKLRAAYEELDTFSYTISHDLKNPIATIKGYAQLVGMSETLDDPEKGMVNKIIERTNQMNIMIAEVLDYSRIGRQEIDFREVDMSVMIREIVKDLILIYDTKNLNISIGNTPTLKGDPLMLMQVFSNLIGNAVKYSQDAGIANIHIEGVLNKDECCYTITDNGHGIAEEDLPKIFDLFSRMKNVSHVEGSGVGLAIVRRIIERHKGRIWVKSQLGKGSVFSIAFNI